MYFYILPWIWCFPQIKGKALNQKSFPKRPVVWKRGQKFSVRFYCTRLYIMLYCTVFYLFLVLEKHDQYTWCFIAWSFLRPNIFPSSFLPKTLYISFLGPHTHRHTHPYLLIQILADKWRSLGVGIETNTVEPLYWWHRQWDWVHLQQIFQQHQTVWCSLQFPTGGKGCHSKGPREAWT